MDEKLSLNMFDNDVVKWKHNGTLYALHVQSDDNSINPRTDMDNVTIMACWHRRYSLGIPFKTNNRAISGCDWSRKMYLRARS